MKSVEQKERVSTEELGLQSTEKTSQGLQLEIFLSLLQFFYLLHKMQFFLRQKTKMKLKESWYESVQDRMNTNETLSEFPGTESLSDVENVLPTRLEGACALAGTRESCVSAGR